MLHLEELTRLYAGGSIEHVSARRIVDDAVAELLAGGLIHRLEQFVFVSQAARRWQRLAL